MKRQRSASPSKITVDSDDHEIWISSKIEDRASIFQAYFSPTMPARELQSLSEIKSSSHRILAWRSPSSQRTLVANVRTLETGTDDDGERYSAKHVLKVLEEMRVEGALVVARWYGGVMLGPVRFGHIEDCARDVIRSWRQNEDSEGMKRRRVEDEAMEKASLVVELTDRDQNIKVLRDLLEQKTKPRTVAEQDKTLPKPAVREIDYATMTLERLRLLDKARDNTVAFLLKKIDGVEKQNVSKPGNEISPEEKVAENPKDHQAKEGDLCQTDMPKMTESSNTESIRGTQKDDNIRDPIELLDAKQDTATATG